MGRHDEEAANWVQGDSNRETGRFYSIHVSCNFGIALPGLPERYIRFFGGVGISIAVWGGWGNGEGFGLFESVQSVGLRGTECGMRGLGGGNHCRKAARQGWGKMSRKTGHILGIRRVIALPLIGCVIGWWVAWVWNPLPLEPRQQLVPAAYLVPKIPGGTALRMAMVHDVLHERYLRHGTAWYMERNAEARKIMEIEGATTRPSERYLDAMDDLAVGLERVGQFDEGIAVMRNKLSLLPPLPGLIGRVTQAPLNGNEYLSPDYSQADHADLTRILASQNLTAVERQQYSACANLGTILLMGNMQRAIGGDGEARNRVREALNYIELSIQINPGAHFGREVWQAIVMEGLLADMDHPELLGKYDLIGDPVGAGDGPGGPAWDDRSAGRPQTLDPDHSAEDRLKMRSLISRVGIDKDWQGIVNSDYSVPMPFDEPTLAIIGMWTLGGGPNPHFALALARFMDEIGQSSIAWNGYERAVEMKDQFWPDPAVCAEMVDLCRSNQLNIARQENPDDPQGWQDKMRKVHQAELAWGMAYQKSYQEFEAARIAAGVRLDDPDFYTPFFKGRPSIASDPGLVDYDVVTHLAPSDGFDFLPCMVLGAGLWLMYGLVFPDKKAAYKLQD
jgi:hypothetical protein